MKSRTTITQQLSNIDRRLETLRSEYDKAYNVARELGIDIMAAEETLGELLYELDMCQAAEEEEINRSGE